MAARVPVTFAPAGVTVWVPCGSTVLAAARAAGVIIAAPCGGRGVCGSCGVHIVDGLLAPPDDTERLGLSRAPEGMRLACRARVDSAVTVRPIVNQGVAIDSVAVAAAHPSGELVAGVDLGTTTVSAVIISSESGRELGRATVPNAQAAWGADVLTRITAAISGDSRDLADAAARSVLQALEEACGKAGTCLASISALAVAANTAMAALLAEADPSSLAAAPFAVPKGLEAPGHGLLAASLPNARIEMVEPIASFVGGDAAAGLLAAGMLSAGEGGSLPVQVLLDLGTNAEVLVTSPLGLTVASAPAGPAFEGFGIAYGGAWGAGAIEDVSFDGSALSIAVAGGGEARWLCGSGLVSAIVALRRAGHLAVDGRMTEQGVLADRFTRIDDVLACSLAIAGHGAPYLLQTDVRSFQTAKSAVASALEVVLKESRVKTRAITTVHVAGGFGSALISQHLFELGVVPQDFEPCIELAGNTALHGAAMLAFEPELRETVREDLQAARHVELATNQAFASAFMEHLSLEPFRLEGERRGLFHRGG